MSSPPALNPVEKQEEGQTHKQEEGQTHQLNLPPPPVPSASSSPFKIALPLPASSTTIWPFSDPSLIFYLDSTPKAESLKRNLERRALAAGLIFRTTDDATQASHVILDSSSNDNLTLRSLPRPVSLEWLKDSFFEEKGLPEEDYRLSTPPTGSPSDREEGGEDVDERSEFVSRVPPNRVKLAWRHEEEADLARFLASDPLKPGQKIDSIWELYQKSHPSRTVAAYREHHRGRREAFFDSRVAELKAANNGQPIVYEHPEVEESSHDEEPSSFVPFVETRSVPHRSQPLPSYVPAASEPKPLIKGKCSNCDVDQAVSFSRIKGKGDKMFCGGCYMAAYMANRKTVGTGDRALAARRRKVLAHQAKGRSSSSDLSELEDSSEGSSSDASEIADPGPSRRPPHPSSSRTRKSVRKSSTAAPYAEQEDLDLVRLLASWEGARGLMWETFSKEHPGRSAESARKRYQLQRERMDREISDLQRKNGKKTRPTAASESEELEDDDSMGDDEHSDDDSKPLRPSASRPSSSTAIIDRKRPQEPLAQSSKRMRFDSSNASTNAVASSSKLPSSSNLPHHHRHSLSASSSHFRPYPSNYHPQPRSSLPSSSQQPVASNLPSSSRTNDRPSTSFSSSYPRPPPAPPLAPSRPPPPPSRQASLSSSEEDLEPPSFLELGTKPTGCSPSSPWCFFCGCDKDGSDTFNEISLAGKNPNTGEIQKVRARLACDVCESSWEKRFVKGKKLGMGVAEMGELERLAWVTEVLIEKGLKVTERRVKGWNWDGGRSR